MEDEDSQNADGRRDSDGTKQCGSQEAPSGEAAGGARRDRPTSNNRRTIPTTCKTHPGSVGFCNLRVTKLNGDIVLDPHVLRHEALCCIPYRVGRDLEEDLWV